MKADRPTQLLKVRELLARPESLSIAAAIREIEEQGDPALAAVADVMLAAQHRDLAAIMAILQAPRGRAIWTDPCLSFAAAWSLYWTAGLVIAGPDLARAYESRQLMPTRWREDLEHLLRWRVLFGDRQPTISGPPESEIHFLAGQPMAVVSGALNGERVVFIVDTGAPTSVIATRAARRCKVRFDSEAGRAVSDGGGQSLTLYPAVADEMTLGVEQLTCVPVHVAELGSLNVDGILSPLDVFRDHWLEFDGPAQLLRIHRGARPHGGSEQKASLRWNEGSPILQIRLLGQEAAFLLDSGAGANILARHLADRTAVRVVPAGVRATATAAGQVELLGRVTTSWAVGGAPLEDVDLLVKVCTGAEETLFPGTLDGHVGAPWFRPRRVVFPPRRDWIGW